MLSLLSFGFNLCSASSSTLMGTTTHHNRVYATEIKIPIGYRFLPTDLELVAFYLNNKNHSFPIPVKFMQNIEAAQLYTKTPNTLTEESLLHDDDEYESYFFVNRDSQRNNVRVIQEKGMEIRMVGKEMGFWVASDVRVPIYDSKGAKFGFKFVFSYYVGTPQNPVEETDWKMEEYYLPLGYCCQGCCQGVEEIHEWMLVRVHKEKTGGYDSS